MTYYSTFFMQLLFWCLGIIFYIVLVFIDYTSAKILADKLHLLKIHMFVGEPP